MRIVPLHGATLKRIPLCCPDVAPEGTYGSKHRLTDRKLQALRRGGTRYDVMDTDVPGFGVRVSEIGQRTFILIARYPGSSNPTRRASASIHR